MKKIRLINCFTFMLGFPAQKYKLNYYKTTYSERKFYDESENVSIESVCFIQLKQKH